MSIGRINCKECVADCKAWGGSCEKVGREMAEGLEQDGITNWRNIVGDHRRDAHRMNITGALWTCERGHELEANPSDVMLAAGIRPML